MATNYTEHYQLNQWEPGDKVLRTDFNADNLKIDAALKALAQTVAEKAGQAEAECIWAAMPKVAAGTYTGSGGTDLTTAAKRQTIPLDFHPKAVLVYPVDGIAHSGTDNYGYRPIYGGLATRAQPAVAGTLTNVAITEGGFTVNHQIAQTEYNTEYFREYYPCTNRSGKLYSYIAIG